jgi:hypothetical protein
MHPSNSYASKRFTKGGKGTSKSKIRTKLQATEQDSRNFIAKLLITLLTLLLSADLRGDQTFQLLVKEHTKTK